MLDRTAATLVEQMKTLPELRDALREAADDRAVFELDERKQVLLQVEVGVEVGSVERVESVAELGPELAANEFF